VSNLKEAKNEEQEKAGHSLDKTHGWAQQKCGKGKVTLKLTPYEVGGWGLGLARMTGGRGAGV
jgi:hypothetical protein